MEGWRGGGMQGCRDGGAGAAVHGDPPRQQHRLPPPSRLARPCHPPARGRHCTAGPAAPRPGAPGCARRSGGGEGVRGWGGAGQPRVPAPRCSRSPALTAPGWGGGGGE